MTMTNQQPRQLRVIIWNIKGLAGCRDYTRPLLNDNKPDIIILSETKMKRPVIPHVDTGSNEYKAVQIKSTVYARGGLVMLVKQELKVIRAGIIRKEDDKNFVHSIVLKNKDGEEVVGCYNSPTTTGKFFNDRLKKFMTDHDVR